MSKKTNSELKQQLEEMDRQEAELERHNEIMEDKIREMREALPKQFKEITQARQKIEEENYCDICYLPFNSATRIPRVFFCGHTFCEECAQRLIALERRHLKLSNRSDARLDVKCAVEIKCPTCRVVTKINSGKDAQQLVINEPITHAVKIKEIFQI